MSDQQQEQFNQSARSNYDSQMEQENSQSSLSSRTGFSQYKRSKSNNQFSSIPKPTQFGQKQVQNQQTVSGSGQRKQEPQSVIPVASLTVKKEGSKKFQPSNQNYVRSKSHVKKHAFGYTPDLSNQQQESYREIRLEDLTTPQEEMQMDLNDVSGFSSQLDASQVIDDAEDIFGQGNSKDNVKVCIRVRPLNDREKTSGGKTSCVQIDKGTVHLDRGFDTKKFNFDFVGHDKIDQVSIFNQIAKPIADSCMLGYNGTIFAYGQTGAGKTYTIQGPMINTEAGQQMALQNSVSDPKGNRGIMQRSFEYIFQNIEAQKNLVDEKQDGSELNFLIKCSYLEIYNEQIMDLLEPASVNLHIREDIKKGVYVEGLQEDVCNSYKDTIQLIQKGSKNRHVGSTAMNRESSRSHSVLTTIIESKSMSSSGVWNMKTSRFHIIDLAGSERSKNTNAVGERLKEAGMINKSLSALGNVINSLVEISEGKNKHVPYRDSKLTFILRDSLGGNSKTVIIANISPSSINQGETLSTLEFAKRAKQIKNKAVVNEDSSGTILVLKNEIKRLKKNLVQQSKSYQSLMVEKKALAQQHYQTSDQANSNKANQDGICSICKANIREDRAIQKLGDFDGIAQDGMHPEADDSLLLDDFENETPEKGHGEQDDTIKKLRAQLTKQNERVIHVEKLLCTNLENLTSQEKYFQEENRRQQDLLKEMQQSYDALNQQVNRDKMKMKLREDKIAKLEQEHAITPEENYQILEQELKLLKEQLEQEKQEHTNPQIQKLKQEKHALQERLDKKEHEVQIDEFSIQKQLKENMVLLDQLNSYIQKAGMQTVDNLSKQVQEMSKLKPQLEELQTQYDVLLQQNVTAEESNQKITREFGRAKVELTNISQQLQHKDEMNHEYQIQLEEIKDQLVDKHTHCEQLQFKMNNLTEKESQNAQKITQLTDSLELKEKVVVQKDEIIKQKDENIQMLKQESTTLQTNLEAKLESKQQELCKIIAEQQSLKKELEDTLVENSTCINNMNKKLAEQVQINENLLIQVDEVNNGKKQIQADLNQKIEEAIKEKMSLQLNLNSKIEEIQTQVVQEKSGLQEKEKVISDKESAISGLKLEKEELSSLNESLNLKVKENSTLIESLNAQIAELSPLVEGLYKKVTEQDELIGTLKAKITEKEDQLKKVQGQGCEDQEKSLKQLKDRDEIIQNLTDSKNQLQQSIENLKDQTIQQKQLLKEQEQLLEQLADSNKSHEQEIEKLKEENAQTKADYKIKLDAKIQEMNEEMDKRAADQSVQLEMMQTKIAIAQNKIDEEQQQRDQNIQNQTIEIQHQIEEIQNYQSQIKQLKDENKNFESNVSYLDESMVEMSNTLQNKDNILDELKEQNINLIDDKETLRSRLETLERQVKQFRSVLSDQYNETEGMEVENAEAQVLLMESQNLIESKVKEAEDTRKEISQKDQRISKLLQDFEEFKDSSQEEIRKLEVEKDALQFKRDENIKQLEAKIQEYKSQMEQSQSSDSVILAQKVTEIELLHASKAACDKQIDDLNQENNTLQAELEKIKNGELLNQNALNLQLKKEIRKFENIDSENKKLKEQMEEKEQKMKNLMQEVTDMQAYIDDLTEKMTQANKNSKEMDKIKNNCYKQIENIQQKHSKLIENANVDLQKQEIKLIISTALAEISDVSLNNNLDQKSIQVNLLISQIVCEISKLYEKQIVLEKQKSAQEYKKATEKYDKQKSEIKKMQQYHVEKLQELAAEHKVNLDKQLKERDDQVSADQQHVITELQAKIEADGAKKEEIQKELDRYKVYLPEAEDLLQEVNERHKSALDELQALQKKHDGQMEVSQQYENEILDLNRNLKQQKKMLQDQKQLYEVRVQSQEQEIEQHQYRYKELETRMQKELTLQDQKFVNVQDQVDMATNKSNKDREIMLVQMQELQNQIASVQKQDLAQQNEIRKLVSDNKILKQKVQKRENEMSEAVKTLNQFGEANKYLEKENDRLRTENEQLAGHKNPNQKIQLHLKIKEENNKLREDNLKLQEDLQKKIDMIQKMQKAQMAETLTSPTNKVDQRVKKDFETLVNYLISQPQIQRLAQISNISLDVSGSQTLPKMMELITITDEILEQNQEHRRQLEEQIHQLRQHIQKNPPPIDSFSSQPLPPKIPQSQSQAAQNSHRVREQKTQSALSRGNSQQNSHGNLASTQKYRVSNNSTQKMQAGSDMKPNQYSTFERTSSVGKQMNKIQPQSQQLSRGPSSSSSKQLLHKQLSNFVQGNDNSQLGSPVMLNSYSSMYKQNNRYQQQPQHESNQKENPSQADEYQIAPPNNFQQPLGGYSQIVNKQKQYKSGQQSSLGRR